MLAQPKMKKDRPRKVCAPETHYYDPLYQFHQWLAKLRLLEETEINTVPYVPLSHPFVERLIGTLRRECRDRTLFWTITNLEAKLLDFRHYHNEQRTPDATGTRR